MEGLNEDKIEGDTKKQSKTNRTSRADKQSTRHGIKNDKKLILTDFDRRACTTFVHRYVLSVISEVPLAPESQGSIFTLTRLNSLIFN